jgi:hypothetical protein
MIYLKYVTTLVIERCVNENYRRLCITISRVCGISLAASIGALAKYQLAVDSVRDAIYFHADKITPEVIEQANRAADDISKGDLYLALFNFGIAGSMIIGTRSLLRSNV